MMNLRRWTGIFFVVLLVNTGYIAGFSSATIFYMVNVLFHLGLGLAVAVAAALLLMRNPELRRGIFPTAGVFALSIGFAIFLAGWGNTQPHRWAFWAHIITASLGTIMLAAWVRRHARQDGGGWIMLRKGVVFGISLAVLLPATGALYRTAFPNPADRIKNTLLVPTTMDEEGGGPQSPFFPSAAQTNTGDIIPSNFFMDSETCGECHADIYEQWNSSVHHFASFNNQFYRKSIEYMQDVVGTEPSKWCAGCHDHAVFFNGRFDRPIKEQIDTPEAHAGLACTSCHSIVHVNGSVGNGGFLIQYPPLHELATSKNPYMRSLDRFLTFLNPRPHRESFMKPFMREDAAEYCSSCHKVHLDVPVNEYRWFRGFNDYDAWQASGVSGQGARSFYYPEKTSTCVDCHMPLVPSQDPGHHDGQVHSHRFPAANTAVPTVNHDAAQLMATEKLLKSGFITVDIFAASPVDENHNETPMVRRASSDTMQSMSSFAVGEESDAGGQVLIREVGDVAAPIDKAGVKFRPGSTVRVDVVVRTRRIGHFFPGGTVDAFDVWLELEGRDATGKLIYWSGAVEDEGRGAVEKGAHFYRSYMLDGDGNMINKRNAWQARSVLYVRLIPPGAADTAHYRVKIPSDAVGPITLTAKLNHRKFSQYYNEFAFAGEPVPGQASELLGPAHNSLEYSFEVANIPANVSGKLKGEIPVLPITVIAQDEAKLELGDARTEPKFSPIIRKEDRERWNDWGIGMLLQGDLKGAEYAFLRTTEAEPEYADGWLNVARALIQEGETEAAKPYIEKALAINAKLGRIHFFKAMIQKADGDYDAAISSLRTVAAQYPKDRVVLNQLGRILFLKRDFAEAVKALERVTLIDTEDVQAHYTLMLAYRGLKDMEKAARSEKLFRRFKAEEAAQAITGKVRLINPEDNNERQQIHEHESVPLPWVTPRATGAKPVAPPVKAAANVPVVPENKVAVLGAQR